MYPKTRTVISLLVIVLSFVCLRPVSSMADGGNRKEQIHLMLYDIYKKQQRYDLAGIELRELIKLRPNDAKLRGSLGTDLFTAQKWGLARTEFNNATKYDPTNADYWGMIGRCDMQLRQYFAAYQAYQKAVRSMRAGGTDYRPELATAQTYYQNEQQQKEYAKQQVERKKNSDDDDD